MTNRDTQFRRRQVEPRYQEAYDRINRITPDRPGNFKFEELFAAECTKIDRETRWHSVPSAEEHIPPRQSLLKRLVSRIRKLFSREQ